MIPREMQVRVKPLSRNIISLNTHTNTRIFRISVIKLILTGQIDGYGTIFFFHGLGDDSENWEEILNKLFCDDNAYTQPSIKIFCPKSPEMPMTNLGGKVMNAWFNVFDSYTSDNQGICNAARVSD